MDKFPLFQRNYEDFFHFSKKQAGTRPPQKRREFRKERHRLLHLGSGCKLIDAQRCSQHRAATICCSSLQRRDMVLFQVFITSRTQSDRCSSEELISVNFIINRQHSLLMFRRQGLSSNLHYGKNFSGQQWITIYLKLIYSHFISWSKATRNPISIFVTRGEHHARAAQRQLSLSIVKSPPRTTLSVPVFGPVGFQANPPEPP